MNREKIIPNMHDLNRKNGLCKRENHIYIIFYFYFSFKLKNYYFDQKMY